MAITWSDFKNGDTLLSIRTGLNSFNNSVVSAVNINTNKVSNVDTNLGVTYSATEVLKLLSLLLILSSVSPFIKSVQLTAIDLCLLFHY